MNFFNKLKSIFSPSEKIEETKEIKKVENKDIKISDEDILYSLNYNILIKKRKYNNVMNNVIFEEYKNFKFIEEMKDYYEIDDDYIIFYVDKYEKFQQIINNISVYLEIKNKDKLMYDYKDYSLYSNIFEVISKERKKIKEFDFFKFFKRFEWVRKCEKFGNTSIKLDLCDNNNIEIRYRIIKNEKEYVIGKFRDELIKIDFVFKRISFGLKIKGE